MPSRSRSLAVCLIPVAFAALAGCATQPDVRHDQDPSADLGAYKTFAFFEPVAAERARYSTIASNRLKQATRAQLERRHYLYSETNPDLRVNLLLDVVERQELRATPARRGFYGYRSWATHVDTVNYRQGTLAIDVVDAKRKTLVWQGIAEGRLTQKPLDDPGPAVETVVAGIFAKFPGSARP